MHMYMFILFVSLFLQGQAVSTNTIQLSVKNHGCAGVNDTLKLKTPRLETQAGIQTKKNKQEQTQQGAKTTNQANWIQ